MKRRLFIIGLLTAFTITVKAASPITSQFRSGADRTLVLTQNGTDFGFFMPETGGYLKTGLIIGDTSLWLKDATSMKSRQVNRGFELTIRDKRLGKGELRVQVQPLSDCNGLVMKVSGSSMPDGIRFLWAYGGCSADTFPSGKTTFFQPEQCRDNVFSREINAFTVYYGRTERLKVMMGVAPLETETRLSDARRMTSPAAFWNSGKKTDAPALAGSNPLSSGTDFYYCIYRQNQSADYNYYLLSALFEKEAASKSTISNEEAQPHTGFGPDFHQQ